MAWVRSEYAGEFAVISAWLSMVLPWNIVYQPDAPLNSTVVFFRFSLFEIQIRFPFIFELGDELVSAANALAAQFPGTRLFSGVFVTTPLGAVRHYGSFASSSAAGQYLTWGSYAWALGALALLCAFGYSLALYWREDEVERRSPTDPVRTIGGLLAVATVATALASVLYFFGRSIAGIPIPVGVLVMGALSVALLRVERR